ncbi:glycosyltransferase family 2 protein [Porphyromonas gingivalis]|uniref:glycosyltransferase family 2 protein n=1 Tax=Porphyromonas gingivalis TaxID=837 RepID=UPI0006BAC105|nr:glycosyltransferase family 2 protein [Porphyromonas gingivalis]PDP65374.1 glycosyltransferase family 2 protein [Porphyromonas gingivalis]RRG13670.1 glycosyltransferase family 2 protein [Porphyromonas gingivalis]GAP80824.1 glycosyl transferase family 2 [Porphyromonas gingivalis]
MTTAVIILNWNGRKMLEEFLPSLIAHTPRQSARLIVADNGSTDDSVEFLRCQYPQVELILFPENYGFAEGYNRAIAQTECDCVVLLNSDVEVSEGWLDAPLALLQERSDVAAVQPKIRAFREKHAFEYAGAAGGYVDRWGYPFCRGRIFDTVETDTGQYDDIAEVFWASGAALFIRRQVYMAVGGLDPRFFAHQEEIDLCWRLHSCGWRIAVAPSSTVFHLGGGSLDMKNPRKVYLNFRNNLLMLYKNLPETALKPTMRIRALLDFLSAMVFLLTGKFRHMQAVVRARRDFRRMRPDFSASRSKNLLLGSIPAPMKPYSIVFQFYIRRRKIFSRLP